MRYEKLIAFNSSIIATSLLLTNFFLYQQMKDAKNINEEKIELLKNKIAKQDRLILNKNYNVVRDLCKNLYKDDELFNNCMNKNGWKRRLLN